MGAGTSAQHAQLSLSDPKVCRSFLAGTCPHDLFTNTKQDLGQCPRVHSESLKQEYESSPDKSKLGFEYDYMRDMQKYIDECNRRIDAAQRRLEKTPDEIRQTNDLVSCARAVEVSVAVNVLISSQRAAQANPRPLAHHKHRPHRSRGPRRSQLRKPRGPRIPQDPHCESRQRGERTRTQITIRYFWSVRASKIASV